MNKRQSQINKLNQKIEARTRQKNTDKKDREINKWKERIKKLENKKSLGQKERLKNKIEIFSQRVSNPFISDSGRDYLNRKKEELAESLKKIRAEQKRAQRLKKTLSRGLLPGQLKRGKKPTLSPIEKKRRIGLRNYWKKRHSQDESYLKGLSINIFGKEEAKGKFSTTIKRREKYKGKSGWFSKWVKKTERNLFRAEKSINRSKKKKELRDLEYLTGEKKKKKKKNQSWNNWIDKEIEKLGKKREEEKEKAVEKWGITYDEKEKNKEGAEIWDVSDSNTKTSKFGERKWYETRDYHIVISRASTWIGVWKDGQEYVVDFDKRRISGLYIDFDGNILWTEREN